MTSTHTMGKRETWEPTHFGMGETTLDPCGPRGLSATPIQEWPWVLMAHASQGGLSKPDLSLFPPC